MTKDSFFAFLWEHRFRICHAECPGASIESEIELMKLAIEKDSMAGVDYLSRYFDIEFNLVDIYIPYAAHLGKQSMVKFLTRLMNV